MEPKFVFSLCMMFRVIWKDLVSVAHCISIVLWWKENAFILFCGDEWAAETK